VINGVVSAQRAVTAHEGDDGDARQGLEDEWRLDDDALDMTDAIHCCAWCNYTCSKSLSSCRSALDDPLVPRPTTAGGQWLVIDP
jgi:hypothetical protein